MDDMLEAVSEIVADVLGCTPAEALAAESLLLLGADSIDFPEIVCDLEDAYDINLMPDDMVGVNTVAGLVALVNKKRGAV